MHQAPPSELKGSRGGPSTGIHNAYWSPFGAVAVEKRRSQPIEGGKLNGDAVYVLPSPTSFS